VNGSWKQGNELSDFMKGGKFLGRLNHHQLQEE
jgi:hypothetical protein